MAAKFVWLATCGVVAIPTAANEKNSLRSIIFEPRLELLLKVVAKRCRDIAIPAVDACEICHIEVSGCRFVNEIHPFYDSPMTVQGNTWFS